MSLMVKEILQIAERRLQESHCMDPRLDAELIFCDMLSLDKTQLFLRRPTMLDEGSCEKYFDLIDIRAGGRPVQYITGKQEFMGLTFKVNEHVLIPRQDTETLVEEVIETLKKSRKKLGSIEVLDLCCGSGAIGISLAKLIPDLKVTAADISAEALLVAKENAAKIRLTRKMKFIESDLFSKIKKGFGGKKFDIIVSNPPYVKTHLLPILQREIKEYEPMIALDGGEDGLKFYRTIIEEAPNYLKKEGKLFLEIGHDQAEDILGLLAQSGRFTEAEVIKDAARLDRVVKCELAANKKSAKPKKEPKVKKEKKLQDLEVLEEQVMETAETAEVIEGETPTFVAPKTPLMEDAPAATEVAKEIEIAMEAELAAAHPVSREELMADGQSDATQNVKNI